LRFNTNRYIRRLDRLRGQHRLMNIRMDGISQGCQHSGLGLCLRQHDGMEVVLRRDGGLLYGYHAYLNDALDVGVFWGRYATLVNCKSRTHDNHYKRTR